MGEPQHAIATNGHTVRVRVGETDQTAHSKSIETWVKGRGSRPFIRGVHFSEDDVAKFCPDVLLSEQKSNFLK